MNAANFSTFSTGIGTHDFAITMKYLHDFPKEWYKLESMGILKTLPRHKEEPELEKPAYVTEVKYSMTGGIILDGMCPRIGSYKTCFGRYKYTMYHKTHGTDRTLEVVQREWDNWQKEWKARGIQHEYVPYPYTKEVVSQWFKDWSALMKMTITVDGKDDEPGPWEDAGQARALMRGKATE